MTDFSLPTPIRFRPHQPNHELDCIMVIDIRSPDIENRYKDITT